MTQPFNADQILDNLHDAHQYEGEVAVSIQLSTLDYSQLAAVAQLTSSEPLDDRLSGDDLIEQIGTYLDMSAENNAE